jgi:hypothetical protein
MTFSVCMLKNGILLFVYVEKNGIHKSMHTYFRDQRIRTFKMVILSQQAQTRMLKNGTLLFVYVENNGIHKSMHTYFRDQRIRTYKNGNPQSTSTDAIANHLFLRKETLIFFVKQIHYCVRKKPKHFQVIKTKYPSKQFFLFQIKYYFIF